MTDTTHDPGLRSWVDSANRPGCDFPIQNLPLGVFQAPGEGRARLGVAVGDALNVQEQLHQTSRQLRQVLDVDLPRPDRQGLQLQAVPHLPLGLPPAPPGLVDVR